MIDEIKNTKKILKPLGDLIVCRERFWFDPHSYYNFVFIGIIFLVTGIRVYRIF
jgi:hypothetical protein